MYLSNIYIYAYCYSLNKHAWLPSEVCCSFKVYLNIPPYFVFAESGGSVKPVHMRWLAQTLPLAPICKKPPANLIPVLGRSAKDLASLYTYAQSRKSLRTACERIYCKYFKHVCVTVLVFGVPVQKVWDLQRLLRCLLSFENVAHEQWSFCEILVLNSCVSSVGSNQPMHLFSLARAFTACTQCTYRICTNM